MLHRATSALVNPVKLGLKVRVILLRNPLTARAAIHPGQQCFMVCSQQTVSEVLQSSKGRQKPREHSRHLQSISTSTQQAALRQVRKANVQVGTRSERARSCSPLIHQCLVHSCDGPQARKTHPKSHLETDQANLT